MNENQVIVLEDLHVQGMIRNKHLSKYMSESGWSKFGRMVEYKTQGHEKVLEWKAPHFTSQRCSECGYTHKDNQKSQSLFECQRCGYKDHADFNASKNLSGSDRTTETQRKAVVVSVFQESLALRQGSVKYFNFRKIPFSSLGNQLSSFDTISRKRK